MDITWIGVGLFGVWTAAFAYCEMSRLNKWAPRRNAFVFGAIVGIGIGVLTGIVIAVVTMPDFWFFGMEVATPRAIPLDLVATFGVIFAMIGSILALALRWFGITKIDLLALNYH